MNREQKIMLVIYPIIFVVVYLSTGFRPLLIAMAVALGCFLYSGIKDKPPKDSTDQ